MSAHGVAGPRDAAVSGGRSARPATPARPGGPGAAERQPAPEPDGRPQPDLRVVALPDAGAARRQRLFRLACAAAGLFVAAVVFALVGLHVVLAQNQFRLDRLNAQAQAQATTYQRLRLQVDQLESPQRIVAAAEGRLGMVQPAAITWLSPSHAAASASATTPAPATAATAGSVPATASSGAATVPATAGAASASTTGPAGSEPATGSASSVSAGGAGGPSWTIPAPAGPAGDWSAVKPQLVNRP